MLGTAFFDSIRVSLFGGSLSQSQVDALKAIDAAWQKHGTHEIDAQAYTFATIFNEVGASMLPKAENLNYSAARAHEVWPSKFPTIAAATPYQHDPVKLGNFVYANILGNGGPASGDGYRYRGHGYQTTGRAHFTTFAQILGVDLVAHPELLDQSVELAAAALIIGMVKGLYTGKSFETYLDGKDEADSVDLQEFINARRIVNGTFNAVPIAQNAIRFEHALRAATTIGAAVPAALIVAEPVATAASVLKPSPDPIIQAWQERLQAVAKAESKPDPLPKYGADGLGGGETRDAIKAFQSSHPPLTVTGQFDDATRAALEQHPKLPPITLSPIAEFAIKAALDAVIPPSPAKDFLMFNFGNIVSIVVGLLPGLPDDVNKIRAVLGKLVTDANDKNGIAGLRDSARFARIIADELDKVADTLDPAGAIQPTNPIINK